MTRATLLAASLLLAPCLLVAGTAQAATRLGRATLGVEDSTTPTVTFAPDTSRISVHLQLLDTAANDTVEARWIAVKTAAASDYLITTATLTLGAGMREANFSLAKPADGWPAGSYRVDVRINGQQAESVPFDVR